MYPKTPSPTISRTPELLEQWSDKNKGDPSKITLGSSEKVWWECQKGHEWSTEVNKRSKDSGCPVCLNRVIQAGVNDLATSHPQIAQLWSKKNTLSPTQVVSGSSMDALWNCKKGHEWAAKVNAVVKVKVPCPYCGDRRVLTGFNDLATRFPEVAKRWSEKNQISPSEVLPKTNKEFLFHCDCGDTHLAKVSSFVRGVRCNQLRSKERAESSRERSLAALYPEVAVQLHSSNKVDPWKIKPMSQKSLLWECEMGHQWTTLVSNRTNRGSGCPFCAGSRVIPGVTDLGTQRPEIAHLWSSRNKEDISTVPPTRNQKFWWVCQKGHEFFMVPATVKPSSCPVCNGQEVLKGFNDLVTLRPEIAEEWSENNEESPSDFTEFSHRRVSWSCEKGHTWIARISDRSRGDGCPLCNPQSSNAEKEVVEFLKEKLPGTLIKENDRDLIAPLEVDVYIPEKNIAVEFNGLRWHSELFKENNAHFLKFERAFEKGVQLIQIWEDDWTLRRLVVERMLLSKLGILEQRKVSARKTQVMVPTFRDSLEFLEKNHLQGGAIGRRFGLTDEDGTLVAILLYKFRGAKEIEIVRYASSANVQGGFSKLLKHLEREFEEVKSFVTFSDNDMSLGTLYERNGFIVDSEQPPDYSYLYQGRRHHKFAFRKNRFKKDPKLLFQDGLTEKELAKLNGIYRVYGSGRKRWRKVF